MVVQIIVRGIPEFIEAEDEILVFLHVLDHHLDLLREDAHGQLVFSQKIGKKILGEIQEIKVEPDNQFLIAFFLYILIQRVFDGLLFFLLGDLRFARQHAPGEEFRIVPFFQAFNEGLVQGGFRGEEDESVVEKHRFGEIHVGHEAIDPDAVHYAAPVDLSYIILYHATTL